jgi:hypothetical protein
MADYSDWELHSLQLSDLTAARTYFGLTQADGFLNGVRYSINLYGTKYIPSTTQFITDFYGNRVAVMVAQPGYYAILRWNGPTFPPQGVNLPPRVTCIPLPADSPYVFA